MSWLGLAWAHIERTRAEWIAALACLVGVTAIAAWQGYGLSAGLALIGLLAGGFISILIHELGHALGAWLVGWRVWIISALPVCLRLGHSLRFSAALHHDVGGFVLASPVRAAHERRWRSIVFTAAGPLASLISGPAFIYWLASFPAGSWQSPHMAGLLGGLLALGFHSSAAAAFTLWPHRSASGHPSDMLMILRALFGPSLPEREAALGWAGALFEHGVEPRAWPDWMREGVALAGSYAPELAFAAALEAGDEAAARAIAERCQGQARPVLRAFALGWFDANAQAADDALAGLAARPHGPALARFRTLAIIRIQALSGARDSAARMIEEFAAELAQSPTPHPFWEAELAKAASLAERGR